ncbi:DUF421 domain-containing protein [Effusibacillus pohliae]|uniref:DUF421 domain-containing protein n=1 Tax=Effusibacillus pohliae TaxID=232270 RepID=UPI001FE0E3B3|nr:DUF421 domain-containing protein [Effusibacillus pohliae]
MRGISHGVADVLRLAAKTMIVYVLVLIALRVMGKREIGKLSVFDLVVSIMIAEVAAVSLDLEEPFWRGFYIVSLLVTLQILVSFLSLKSHRFRELIEGRPAFLIRNGKIDDAEMRRTRYSMSDLLTQLREKNVAHVGDVEFAILETTGKLSVFPKEEALPVTRGDLGLPTRRFRMPLALIVDGKPMERNLQAIGFDRAWLEEEIRHYGYDRIEDIFFCSIDYKGRMYFDRKDAEQSDREN